MKTLLSIIAFLILTAPEPTGQIVIKGRVTNLSVEPLSGVVVMIKGSNVSTLTDADGKYFITAGPEAKTLVFSLRGMKRLEEPIAGRTLINVILEPDGQPDGKDPSDATKPDYNTPLN